MAILMEICLEELDGAEGRGVDVEVGQASGVDEGTPFVRCVATPGGDPGLTLDRDGAIQWMPEGPAAYGLWTSADHRLVLLRGRGARGVRVERGGRELEAPEEKPVILMDKDLLHLEKRSYRVHVHGETQVLAPPERLTRSALSRVVGAAAAASMALGGLIGAPAAASGGEGDSPGESIQVRLQPPAPMPRKRPVHCSITKQKPTSKGLEIHATCGNPRGLYVGIWGQLLKKKGSKPVPNGSVRVTSLKGKKVVARAAKLKKPVKDAKLRFYVR